MLTKANCPAIFNMGEDVFYCIRQSNSIIANVKSFALTFPVNVFPWDIKLSVILSCIFDEAIRYHLVLI